MSPTFGSRCRLIFVIVVAVLPMTPVAADEPKSVPVAQQRLILMRQRAQNIVFRAKADTFPKRLEAKPLFRYDDLTRGYLDGTVWRLGAQGRALAIVTTELHPRYAGGGPRIVYDFLSLSDVPFRAVSGDVPGWSPPRSAVEMQSLPDGPAPAATGKKRLFQLKKFASRFSAKQVVEGEKLQLRLLPRPIDRYTPSEKQNADGAMFLFVSGRMPGVVLLIETNGQFWKYGVGRLSGESTLLSVSLDKGVVWKKNHAVYQWDRPYTASNALVVIPGMER